MQTESTVARARVVLRSNRYFALATVDRDGPWVATLAFTLIKPRHLYFFSEVTSRHGAALLGGGPVAGVMYDSHCTPSTAESIQFSGRAEVVRDRESFERVLRASALKEGGSPPSSEAIDEQLANESTLLFKVTVQAAFVLDQELFAREGIDGRQPVDFDEVVAGLD